jgi:hypothetical protein
MPAHFRPDMNEINTGRLRCRFAGYSIARHGWMLTRLNETVGAKARVGWDEPVAPFYFEEQDVAWGVGPASPHRLSAAIGD